jgi:hypothetical protein
MNVGQALRSPQAVVPAPPWCITPATRLNNHSGILSQPCVCGGTYEGHPILPRTMRTVSDEEDVLVTPAVAQVGPAPRNDCSHATSPRRG